jgi:hypothetical protein
VTGTGKETETMTEVKELRGMKVVQVEGMRENNGGQ